MLTDPDEAATRLLAFLDSGRMPVIDGPAIPLAAQSICIHGDSPHAVAMGRMIRDRLTSAGVTLAAFTTA